MNGHDPEQRSPNEAANVSASRELFERAVDRVDLATSNRLRLMRRDALSNAPRHEPGPVRRWLPVASIASALIVAGLVWWLPRAPEPTIAATPDSMDVSDATFPADDESELYAWLGEAPVAVDPPQGEAL
jgi:hypothetical protein